MHAKSTVIVFVALLGALTLLNLFTPTRDMSESENRVLQQLPRFSAGALRSGKLTADFDTFVTDQFAFRDSWVGLKTESERVLGRRSSNGVYFAADSYLIEMFDEVDRQRYTGNLALVADFVRRAQEDLGIRAHTVLAPTTSMVLHHKLPRFAPEIDQRALLDEAAAAVPGFVDVSGALEAHSGEYIYYRTDHHWTSLGAYYAYAAWRGETDTPARTLADFEQTVLSDSFYGTTYSKANLYSAPPDTITGFLPARLGPLTVDYNRGEEVTDSIYTPSYLEVKDKYSVFLNANQPIVRITGGAGNGRRLLIVKDSFANSFVQMVLDEYEEITVIDLRYFKLSVHDYMAENGVTDLLVLYNVKNFAGDANLYYLST